MRLRKLSLRHFRNVGFAALEFSGRQQFLLGGNGQGKTNLLEAAGFLTALRSFRTTENKLLVGHGHHTAAVVYAVEHERMGETHVTIKLRHDGKELWSDQARVTRLADHVGKFPAVVFSSQDLQLVRGSPAVRRRWLDLTLAAMDAAYLHTLQTYSRALAARNALLKSGRPDGAECRGRRCRRPGQRRCGLVSSRRRQRHRQRSGRGVDSVRLLRSETNQSRAASRGW